MRRMFEAVDSCPAPVVALVQGHALGGGIGLVACSDIVIAEPDAVFAFSEVKLGIVPAVISPFALRKIGESAARRLFVTGRALRRGDRASDRPRPRGDRRPRRCARARARGAADGRPAGGPAREAARARPARRHRDGAQDRGAKDQRRGTGGAPRVPGATSSGLGARAARRALISAGERQLDGPRSGVELCTGRPNVSFVCRPRGTS